MWGAKGIYAYSKDIGNVADCHALGLAAFFVRHARTRQRLMGKYLDSRVM